jgi:hypothetical protein
MNEFKELLLGKLSVAYYAAAFVFAFLAILISLYMHSRSRNVLSPSTPIKFTWRFLLWDNTKRIFIGLVVMFLIFRLTVEIINKPLSMGVAVGVGFALGFGLDQVLLGLKNKFDILQMDRTKFKIKDDEKPA